MIDFINWRMRVILYDSRQMVGQMLAFDKHMNIVLVDTEEFRRVKRRQVKTDAPGAAPTIQVVKTEEKRTLGLVIIRGSQLVSVSAESPPPADPSARLGRSAACGIPSTLGAGPGVAKPAGRGAPPTSLAGPAAGVGSGAPSALPPGHPGLMPFGRGGPPPGYPPHLWPPAGFPPTFTGPSSFGAPPMGAPPGAPGAPGAPPGGAPGFNPPPRR